MSAESLRPPGADEVHVWWIDPALVTGVRDLLSAEEMARAARFRHADEGDTWSAARGALRRILARYVDDSPEALRLEAGPRGKPTLAPEGEKAALPALRFSVSHAEDRAVVAVAWRRQIGIDLESVHPRWPLQEHLSALMAMTCCTAEAAWLWSLPDSTRSLAFLQIWTIKEAWLKGLGRGLSHDPRSIEVTIDEGRIAVRDLMQGPNPEATCRAAWSVLPLDAGPGWAAALAVAGTTPEIVTRHWPMPE